MSNTSPPDYAGPNIEAYGNHIPLIDDQEFEEFWPDVRRYLYEEEETWKTTKM